MTRSVFGPSLFQESKSDGGSSDEDGGRRTGKTCRQPSTGDASAEAQRGRGCGPRGCASGGCDARSDLWAQVLDIFSLGGVCCRQPESGCAA